MKNLYPFLNPVQWVKARRFARQNAKFDKSSNDLELLLYSRISNNNMLHYGYFEDTETRPETISFEQFENAQMNYSEKIIEHIIDKDSLVLDVGCGMGGFSNLLISNGYFVESLTPNINQITFIKRTYPHITTHNCKYEALETSKKYGTVVNSESLQYISLDEAIAKTNEVITPGGRWVIIDYFSLEKKGNHQKPHHLSTFLDKTKASGWNLVYERNVTPNILPTLKYAQMCVDRFFMPIKQFTFEKLKIKKPKLFFLSERLRASIDQKIEKETKTINPEVFLKDRKYVLLVLEKTH
jgi:cyclopropane fatty-acyl-phospholipid synthase-like methyltransferase